MKKQLIIFISAAIIVLTAGCAKNHFDLSDNPNLAVSGTPGLVLSQALTSTASAQAVGGFPYLFIQCWMGYWSISGSYAAASTDPASYKQLNTFTNGIWQGGYHNLNDYDYIEKQGIAADNPFYTGVAKIMKAFVFQQLVDMFNNIPYTQAFQGTATITPAYDSGQAIYTAITSQIDSAVVLLQSSAAASASTSGDIVFSGNLTSWIQFANTLKLRILMRQSQVASRQSYIQTELASIAANGQGFLASDAGANPGFANNNGQESPTWGFFVLPNGLHTTGGTADYFKTNQYFINFLVNNNDTDRLRRLCSPGGTDLPVSGDPGGVNEATFPISAYVGNTLGEGNAGFGGSGASSVGLGILQSVSQSAILITAAESYFLQAEAAYREWPGFSGAGSLVNQGIQASFSYLGAGDATTYYSQDGNKIANYTACVTPADQLNCIISQKWVAVADITPFEAWSDYRRLGLPNSTPFLSISPYLDNPATIPVRLLYPQSEYDLNTTNVKAQGTINGHTSKVFWNQ